MPVGFLQTRSEKRRIAQRFKRFRAKYALRQEDLARLMDVARKTITAAENPSEADLSVETVNKFMEVEERIGRRKGFGRSMVIPR